MFKISAPTGTELIFESRMGCYVGDESALYGGETAIVIAGTDASGISAALENTPAPTTEPAPEPATEPTTERARQHIRFA